VNRGERDEQLIREETVIGREVAHDGRLHEGAAGHVAVEQTLAADEDAAVAPRLGDRGREALDRPLVDDRAEPDAPEQRVASAIGTAVLRFSGRSRLLVIGRLTGVPTPCAAQAAGAGTRLLTLM
jgi:hypothetical protein